MKAFRIIAALIVATGMVGGLAACEGDKLSEREKKQQTTAAKGETLEIKNLKEKLRREESPSAVRYLYVVSFGKPMGYYVTKGKISSSGSQQGPQDEVVYKYSGSDGAVVDSAQDDGSYGDSDPGIFFFTADGTMVVTSLDYIQSDQPLAFDVPRLLR